MNSSMVWFLYGLCRFTIEIDIAEKIRVLI